MRGGVLAGGIVLFVIGAMLLFFGAAANGAASACGGRGGCQAVGSVALGFYLVGGLVVVGGIALGATGVVLPDKVAPPPVPAPVARQVPVSATRACPACSTTLGADARFCSQCGATIAPNRSSA